MVFTFLPFPYFLHSSEAIFSLSSSVIASHSFLMKESTSNEVFPLLNRLSNSPLLFSSSLTVSFSSTPSIFLLISSLLFRQVFALSIKLSTSWTPQFFCSVVLILTFAELSMCFNTNLSEFQRLEQLYC